MFSECKGEAGGGEKKQGGGGKDSCKWTCMGLQTIPLQNAVQMEHCEGRGWCGHVPSRQGSGSRTSQGGLFERNSDGCNRKTYVFFQGPCEGRS